MSALFEQRRAAVANALAGCATNVTEAEPAAWSVDGSIRVRWDEPWLTFEAGANGAGRDAPWDLLRGQGDLPESCRYAYAPNGELLVVGEVPCEGGADLGRRCREIVAGLTTAREKHPDPPAFPAGTGAAPDPTRALAGEIAWSVNERPDGRLVGKLPDGTLPAELAGDGEGGSRLLVEIAALPPVAGGPRQAISEVLLTAGRFVRFARATVEEHDAGCVVRYETRLAANATAAELRHAQAALAVACDACADEVKVLGNELVAKEYLTVRGASS